VILVVGALIAGAAALQRVREARYPQPPDIETGLYIQSGTAVQRLTKGYNALAADLYWIRAIQYYGSHRLKDGAGNDGPQRSGEESFPLLYPLLDLTTSLDPYFNIAYRFGSIFLSEPPPGGPGRPDLAVKLLEKGLQARPDKWEYMEDIGFVHYWWTHDYAAAADWFDRAGRAPGAPWFLQALAANTRAEGGDLKTSRAMWEGIRDTAEIDWLRDQAQHRLAQIDALQFIDDLQARVDDWKARAGRAPRNWDELVRAGVIPGTPIDPSGVPYVLNDDGTVMLSNASGLHPLPPPPRRLGSA
jgi:hypothetical protein